MRSHAVLMHAGPTAGLRRRGRPGRRGWPFLAWLAGMVAAVAFGAVVIHHVFEPPWIKRHLQSFARSSVGLDIDYRALRLHLLTGAEIEGLVVRSPAELRPLAPDLARVDNAKAYWSPRSLLGRGPIIERLTVSGVVVTVVVDDRGRTSLDALARWLLPRARTPLSHQASRLTTPPPFGRVDVDDLAIVLVRTQASQVLERADLRGVGVAFSAAPSAPDAWRVAAELGTRAQPLDLTLTLARTGAPARSARAKAWLVIDAAPSAVTAALDLRVLDQTLSSGPSDCCSLHAEASARLRPEGWPDGDRGTRHPGGRRACHGRRDCRRGGRR